MSDLKKYIKTRKNSDKAFASKYDEGYEDFKISVVLRSLRKEAGLTQEELAKKMHTQKSSDAFSLQLCMALSSIQIFCWARFFWNLI